MEILKQSKLSRSEWENIEIPVSYEEKDTLQMILNGYSDINIKHNKKMSLFSFTKIEYNVENERFLYNKYFDPIVKEIIKKYGANLEIDWSSSTKPDTTLKKMKSADNLRIQNLDANIKRSSEIIFEYLLLDFTKQLCKYFGKQKTKYAFYLYTLIQLKKNSIKFVNQYVLDFINQVLDYANEHTNLCDVIEQAYEFIERNPYLLAYQDKELFPHQKELFTVFKHNYAVPKLVLYIAPTGTGKTLSPIGLATEYRVIFVCVARHIGLALAKSAISMEKKIAFAFGCDTASDIRLHYYAAVDYTRDRKSGGIRKVDNSNGSKVEIMICDVQSYLSAMHYMLAFNTEHRIITYWDEPTITMDYETHELHEVIHQNWVQNKIPNVVLSCATLPREEEILDTLADFRGRFEDAQIHNITSYDCRKSIPIINKDGYCVLPHILYEDYIELAKCVEYCESNKTVLRYFDLSEIVRFLFYINSSADFIDENYKLNVYFEKIEDITMNSLKIYYLEVLKRVRPEKWGEVYESMKDSQRPKFEKSGISKTASLSEMKGEMKGTKGKSGGGILHRTSSLSQVSEKTLENVIPTAKPVAAGVLLTTEDAYTLTDGPTIFLAEDVAKIAHFYIQQTNIPTEVFQNILRKIAKNNEVSEKLNELEKYLEDRDENSKSSSNDNDDGKKSSSMSKKDCKMVDLDKKSPEIQRAYKEIEKLKTQIQYITLDAVYIPNTKPHQLKWSPKSDVNDAAFVPNIEEQVVRDIMALEIENYQKVLLLMGIGLFMENLNPRYLEIMKSMAYHQHLFLIIASSDYIYGTNYSFCHGFIGKDLTNMTQQKTLQSLGRIGRNNIQQTYSVRFRDDGMLNQLFMKQEENLEALNMCKLFSSE
jgi:hypothetical protein